MGLPCAHAHHAVSDDGVIHCDDTTNVPHAQAIPEDSFAPRKLVRRTLDLDDVGDIGFGHGPDLYIRERVKQLRRSCHWDPRCSGWVKSPKYVTCELQVLP